MLILNEPKVGAAGGALGTACLPGGKEPSWASPPTSSVLFCRLSRGLPLPPRPAHHEISIPLPAFGTAQQPCQSASGFIARQKQRRQLRIVDGAATMQRRCVRVRAIAREALPQIGQTCISPVLIDQTRKADPAATLAAMTRDVEQVELALQLAQRD